MAMITEINMLQNLMVDDTMKGYQQSAMGSLCNLAATFTAIAHMVQGQNLHIKHLEKKFNDKIENMLSGVDANEKTIRSLSSLLDGSKENTSKQLGLINPRLAEMEIRLASVENTISQGGGGGGGGGGGVEGGSTAHIETISKQLAAMDAKKILESGATEQKIVSHEQKMNELAGKNQQLYETIDKLSKDLEDVRKKTSLLAGEGGELELRSDDLSLTLNKFAGLSRQFQSQHTVLDTRFQNFKGQFDDYMKKQDEAQRVLERGMEQKADIKLVLDKVSRTEYIAQVKKINQAQDELLNRTVARDEYKHQMALLRDSIHQDQKQRHANIARIANQLQQLVADVSTKASKSDLIDVASVLNNFPKVHEEIDSLKEFLNHEIAQKTDQIMSTTVDRKQLKKTMARLLKALNQELVNVAIPEDASGIRTGQAAGNNCMSCAVKLKPSKPEQVFDREREVVPSRGGGFMLNSAKRQTTPKPLSSSNMLTIGNLNNLYSRPNRAMTAPGGQGLPGDGDDDDGGDQLSPRGMQEGDIHMEESSSRNMMERGIDGRMYPTGVGASRTHRPVIRGQDDGGGDGGGGGRAARRTRDPRIQTAR